MINNFTKIRSSFISKIYDDEFYCIQIIKRRKDNPCMDKGSRKIKDYYITSKAQLIKYEPEIIAICNAVNGRAYIDLNKHSFRKTALQVINNISSKILSEQYNSVYKSFSHIVGKDKAIVNSDKKFLINFDNDLNINLNEFIEYLNTEFELYVCIDSDTIPTKNGLHIITSPFNIKEFHNKYPNIEVNRKPLSLLYIP